MSLETLRYNLKYSYVWLTWFFFGKNIRYNFIKIIFQNAYRNVNCAFLFFIIIHHVNKRSKVKSTLNDNF